MIDMMKIIIRKLILKLNSKVLKRKTMVVRLGKSRLEFPLSFGSIGVWLSIYRSWEPDQLYMFSKILREGNTVLDIGSNIGYYVIKEAELLHGKGAIFACEPDVRNVEFLKRNISINGLNDIVKVSEVAISNTNCDQELYICEQSNLSALSKSTLDRKYVGKQQVKVITLGTILKQIGTTIDLMRMDIEGQELDVFQSLVDFMKNEDDIRAAPNTIVFETHPWEYQDKDSSEKLFSELCSLGYDFKYISTRREDISPFHEHGYKPIKTIKWYNHRFFGIYQDIEPKLSVNLVCNNHEIRTVCLQRRNDISLGSD
jgi:FkbM family methyltransferase